MKALLLLGAFALGVNAQQKLPQWQRINPAFPLVGRGYASTFTNATAFIALGGRTIDNAQTVLSLGYDVNTKALVETKTSVTLAASSASFPPTIDRAGVCSHIDGSIYYGFGGLANDNLEHNALSSFVTTGAPKVSGVSGASYTRTDKPSPRKSAGIGFLASCPGAVTYCLVIIGGDQLGTKFSDTWIYDPDPSAKWYRKLTTYNAPSARSGAAVVSSPDGSMVYVFGGETPTGADNNVYALAPWGFPDATTDEMVNIAQGKQSYQTSWDPQWGTRGPSAGNDGVITTNHNGVSAGIPATCNCNWCTHSYDPGTAGYISAFGTNPYWSVDLGSVAQADFIYIYARSDGWTYRNAGFQIWASNTNVSQPWLGSSVGAWQVNTGLTDLGAGGPTIINTAGLRARFLYYLLPGNNRILSMCEFQVWQKKTYVWRQLTGVQNAAVGKNAYQSSTLSGYGDGLAIRAVDGRTENNFNNQPYTCSHTRNTEAAGSSAWWLVDLGKPTDVNTISVWGRSDCCTGRNTNIKWYVGNSRDWNYNTFCTSSPADITPPGGTGSITFPCKARGRYVMGVKAIVTAGADANFIQLCEVQVNANKLIDMPAPRANMAFANYGPYMVIFGGADSAGFRSNDVRFFDMMTATWLAPFDPLGTPPVARAFSSFTLLPNGTSTGVVLPGNQFGLFGGVSNVDTLNDFYLLQMPLCPMFDRTGIDSENITAQGTVRIIKCAAFAVATNTVPLVCQADGTWRGILPPCQVPAPSGPNNVVATPIVNSTAVTVTWSAPSSTGYFSQLTQYRVSAMMADQVDTFAANKFPDATKYRLLGTYNGPCPIPSNALCTFTPTDTTNTYDFVNGQLRLNGDLGKNTWFDQREAITMIRDWPTNIVDPAGSWAFETQITLDMELIIFQPSMMAGIGLVDVSQYNNTGYLELYGGLRNDGSFSVGYESSTNLLNNWYSTNGKTSAFIRFTRDATVPSNPIYSMWYKYRSADQWLQMPRTATNSNFRIPGGILPANIRPAMTVRNWNGGSRGVAYFSYLRIGPIACGDPGTARLVSSLLTSTIIYGLTQNAQYKFTVEAATQAGWGALSAPSNAVTIAALPAPVLGTLLLVSQGKPCVQSSDYDAVNMNCGKAFDGLLSTFSHTLNVNPDGEYITVDLRFSTAVKNIWIYNRADCCSDRLRGLQVYVGESTNYQSNAACDITQLNQNVFSGTSYAGPPLGTTNYAGALPCALTGRYVTVKALPNIGWPNDGFLALRQLQVYAQNSCPTRSATGATQVIGTTCSGAGWGAVCTYQCNAGWIQVGGSTSSACNGEVWDAPDLVCAPTCQDLLPSPNVEACTQTYFSENFNSANGTSLVRLMSLDSVTQKIGLPAANPPALSKWFAVDGVLQASSRYGCNSDLHAVISSEKIRNYQSAFTLTVNVRTSDRAGLVWRAQDKLNMYRFYIDVVSGVNVVEKVVNGNPVRITDFPYSYLPDTWTQITVSMLNANINITINGQPVVYTADRTFVVGYAGLYAQSRAMFDDLTFAVPCTSCTGATDQDACTFTCQDGLTAVGPTQRTCTGSSGSPAWLPDVTSQPLVCTLPPPTFIPSTLYVVENSIKNTNVGDPLVAYSPSPDYQIQFMITGCMNPLTMWDVNTTQTCQSLFWIDACSGQVKLRQGGVGVIDYELTKSYILTIRAFVQGFTGAETFRNITVVVLNIDESPIVIPQTVFIPENAASLSTGTVVWNNNFGSIVGQINAWDPENSTVTYALSVDGGQGNFVLNSTSGWVTVAKVLVANTSSSNASATFSRAAALDFETLPNSFTLQLTAVQKNDSSMFGTASFNIKLIDQNDPPVITPKQFLLMQDYNVISYTVGTIQAVDQDVGNFTSNLTYTQVFGATGPSACKITASNYASVGTTGTAGGAVPDATNNMFAVDPATGVVTVARMPTATRWDSWNENDAFLYKGYLVRVAYTMCINVSDAFGGFDVQPIDVLVNANVAARPTIFNVTGAVQMKTQGGEVVTFQGVGFMPTGYNPTTNPPTITAWYTNGAFRYNATCTAVSDSAINCITLAGVGSGHTWNLILITKPVVSTTSMTVSYYAPSVTAITGGTGLLTNGSQLITFTGTNFGPPGTSVVIQYGNNLEFSCAYVSNATDAHTAVRCRSAAGVGQNLPWTITIGGQVASSTAAQLLGYAAPTVTGVVTSGAGFTLSTLDTAGGQTLIITGTNFGPVGTISNPSYGITVTYAGANANLLTFAGCTQGGAAAAHTTLTCKTVPGVGKLHQVTLSVAGIAAIAAWPPGNSTGLSYLPPVVTRIYGPGAKQADTAGGQLVYIEGQYFGPITYPITSIDQVTYGHPGDVGRYRGQTCQVTSEPPQVSVITCATDQGIGAGHSWLVSVGQQQAPIFAASTSYAAPQIIGFSGAGAAAADTLGSQSVVITGRNLGPQDAYTNARLAVYYGTTLQDGVFTNISYTAAACQVTTPHTGVTCNTLVGAGASLEWEVVLDQQPSANPTTDYHEPMVANIAGDAAGLTNVTAANVDGGDLVYLIGRWYGPADFQNNGRSLVQKITYGLSGSEYVLRNSDWSISDDSNILVRLLPGVGVGLRFRVEVADQVSPMSTETFNYAVPEIVALFPGSASTYSNPRQPTIVTMITKNLPLKDPQSRFVLTFGQGTYMMTLPVILPSGALAIAAATNDGTYWPAGTINASFALPVDHAGVGLSVQLSVLQGSSSAPVIATAKTAANAFSYANPTVANVIVTRALFYSGNGSAPTSGDVIACPFPANDPVWSCNDPNVVQLTIVGSNFGADPAKMDHADGVTRKLEFLYRNFTAEGVYDVPGGQERWGTTGYLWQYSWTHTQIVAFGLRSSGKLRLSLTTPMTWTGDVAVQQLMAEYQNLSPSVGALRGAIDNVPCTGSVNALEIDVQELAGSTGLEVWIGGKLATIVVDNSGTLVPVTDVRNQVLVTQPGPTWTIKVLVPPGQGAGVMVQVVRITNLVRDPSNTGFTINYAAPVITNIGVKNVGDADFAYQAVDIQGTGVIRVSTDGSARVRLRGNNLGTAPVIEVADGVIIDTSVISACWAPGANYTCWEFTAPAGEGDGNADGSMADVYGDTYRHVLPFGYKALLAAGNQDSNTVPFRYLPPVVTNVLSDFSFPTSGNVVISIVGSNFGVHNALRADKPSPISITFGRPADSAPALVCTGINRISHNVINCTLPEGSGLNMNVTINVAGVAGGSSGAIWSYNKPAIASAAIVPADMFSSVVSGGAIVNGTLTDLAVLMLDAAVPAYNLTSIMPGVNSANGLLRGNTTGRDMLIIHGTDLGKFNPALHCAFMTWAYRTDDAARVHACDNREDFIGEGEVPAFSVRYWSHTMIVVETNPGLGKKEVQLSIRGNMLPFARGSANLVNFRYNDPVIVSLSPSLGDTEGQQLLTLSGFNFGPTVRNTSRTELQLPDWPGQVWTPALDLSEAPALPTAYVVVTFHTMCVAFAYDILGRLVTSRSVVPLPGHPSRTLAQCNPDVVYQSHNSIVFRSPAGVGANKIVSVQVIEAAAPAQFAANNVTFSYLAPVISSFFPSPLVVGGFGDKVETRVYGHYFGDYSQADTQGWSPQEREIYASAGGFDCLTPTRPREESDTGMETVVHCLVDPAVVPAGPHNFTLVIAGQTGFRSEIPIQKSLTVVCSPGSYARINETCVPCPTMGGVAGANCLGYLPAVEPFEARFTYPVPKSGWYNLNSSDKYTLKWGAPGESMMEACPEGFQDRGRDVCIVPCDPPESCLGDNQCEYGYTSKPPMWRCSSCDTGFYKRAGECIKCPDSPAALFIGFILLVAFVGFLGFMLNRKQINIAVISIGVDFFQVLAIFSQSRVMWPPVVKELLHVLSAFNLNIEIVAPECLIPDVSYKQKFWFIMLLPLSVGFLLLGGIFTSFFVYKALIKGLPKKKWFTHTSTLVSSTLILIYLLYLYLTRTIFDVFNCTPTMPPDGYTYLSVVFERCGVAGGTQLTLLPYAVAGLVVYTFGYPAFIGYMLYKNRELVMEDQLLRAKGVGNDRLTNPHAYDFRRMFGRSYFQFKPDTCLWIVMIVIRKFFIALTAVIFNKNASFQMAACLLVMFIAYSLQMSWRPYMSPGEYDEVLRSHMEASYTSAIHARLRSVLANIETRGRKKARKNLVTFDGKVDRSAVLGILTGWLFNYNTVEQIMIFAAVIVCLMGIMYQANEVNTYYPQSKDSVTGVVLAVIIIAIVYFLTVLFTEIVVLYNEDVRTKQLARQAKLGKGKEKSDKDSAKSGRGKLVSEDGEINVGKVEAQMNPLFLNQNGNAAQGSDSLGLGVDAIMAQRSPPPQEMWSVIQQSYIDMHKQLQAAQDSVVDLKKQIQLGTHSTASADDVGVDGATAPKPARKTAFAPKTSGIEGANGSNPMNSTSARKVGGATALASLKVKSNRSTSST